MSHTSPLDFLDDLSKRRTIRKFYEEKDICIGVLERIIQAGKFAPFSCNLQPIDYVVVRSENNKEKMFPHLTWARHVDGMAPKNGERPSAYIIPLLDTQKVDNLCSGFMEQGGKDLEKRVRRSLDISYGIVEGFMIAQAHLEGLGVCSMAGIDEQKILKEFGIGNQYEIPTILALGYAKETPTLETVPEGTSTKYKLDLQGNLIVPKVRRDVVWI